MAWQVDIYMGERDGKAIQGLRERVWVKFSMKSSASPVASGKIQFAHAPENGGFFQWLFLLNTNACSTHTCSPVSARWSWYAASSATRRRASSLSCGAQKNGLQRVWPGALGLVRPHDTARPRFVLRQHAGLSGVRGTPDSLSMLWQSETGTARLLCRQSVLHKAVCLVRRAPLPGVYRQGCCRRAESGLADGQGTGQAIYDRATGTRRDPGPQGDRHRRNLDPQRAHLPHRGQRPDPAPSDLVWRRRPLGGQHAAVL